MAIDSANNTGRATIHIKILDTNDWTPTFLNDTFFLNVTEGRPSLNQFVQLPVADYDDGKHLFLIWNRILNAYIRALNELAVACSLRNKKSDSYTELKYF